jgi:hypothetical protein
MLVLGTESWWSAATAIGTFILAAITSVYVVLVWRQLGSNRDAVEVAERALEHEREAVMHHRADAASQLQLTREALEQARQADLVSATAAATVRFLDGDFVADGPYEPRGSFLEESWRIIVELEVRNHGPGPLRVSACSNHASHWHVLQVDKQPLREGDEIPITELAPQGTAQILFRRDEPGGTFLAMQGHDMGWITVWTGSPLTGVIDRHRLSLRLPLLERSTSTEQEVRVTEIHLEGRRVASQLRFLPAQSDLPDESVVLRLD